MDLRAFTAILLAVTSFSRYAESFPMHVTVGVVSSLYQRWNSHCLYLIHHMGDIDQVNVLRRRLSENGIESGTLEMETIEPVFTSLKCEKNLPLFVIPFFNEQVKQFLHKVSSITFSTSKWLLFLMTSTSQFFSDIYIPYDCEFLVVQLSDHEVTTLYEVYHVHPTSQLYVLPVANSSPTTQLIWSTSNFYGRRQNLRGLIIKAAVISDGTTSIISKVVNGKPVEIGGYIGHIWKMLQESLNFTTDLMVPTDGTFGSLKPNGTWSGMVGMVKNGVTDMGTAGFSMTKERFQVVDYLSPIVNEKLMVFIQRPEPMGEDRQMYINSFSSGYCLTILGLIAILSFSFWVACLIIVQFGLTDSCESQDIIHIFLKTFGRFCNQGQILSSSYWSLKIIILVSHVAAILVVATFSAKFTSFLTTIQQHLPFTTFQGLLEDGTYILGMLRGSAQLNYFDNGKDATMRRIYTRLISPHKDKLPATELSGLHRVCDNRRFAYMCGLITLNKVKHILNCDVAPITKAFVPVTLAMIIRKDSPYRKAFNYRIQSLRRQGLLEQVLRNLTSTETSPKREEEVTNIGFDDIVPLLELLGYGCLASILILIFEYCQHKTRCHSSDIIQYCKKFYLKNRKLANKSDKYNSIYY